ncbi:MAG: hypothetical protein ACREBC_36655, partial [Pyrinomonadaceae bacterium]
FHWNLRISNLEAGASPPSRPANSLDAIPAIDWVTTYLTHSQDKQTIHEIARNVTNNFFVLISVVRVDRLFAPNQLKTPTEVWLTGRELERKAILS